MKYKDLIGRISKDQLEDDVTVYDETNDEYLPVVAAGPADDDGVLDSSHFVIVVRRDSDIVEDFNAELVSILKEYQEEDPKAKKVLKRARKILEKNSESFSRSNICDLYIAVIDPWIENTAAMDAVRRLRRLKKRFE